MVNQENLNHRNLNSDGTFITFKDIIRILIFGKWIIVFCLFLSILITTYLTFTKPPKFKSSATVMIEEKSKSKSIFNVDYEDRGTIINEIGIIKSRYLANNVIESLWNSKYRNHLYLFNTKTFKPKGQRLRIWLKNFFTFGYWSPEKDKDIKHVKPFSLEIANKYSDKLLNGIGIKNKKGTNIIEISYVSSDKNEAALIANLIVDKYKKIDKSWNADDSMGLETFLLDQIKSKEAELELSEENLKDFKQKNKIFGLEQNDALLLNNLLASETKLSENIAEKNIIVKQKDYIKEKLSNEDKKLADQLSNSINSKLASLKLEIGALESELINLSTVYDENHEAIKNTQNKIKKLKDNLNSETSNLINQGLLVDNPIEYRQKLIKELVALDGTENNINNRALELEKIINAYNLEINQLPKKQMEFARLQRDYAILSETYSHMRQKLEEAKISTASVSGKVRIIDEAKPASGPFSPDVLGNYILGFVFGLIAGVGFLYGREYIDNSVKSIEFIESLGLPILAIIPAIGKENNRRRKNKSSRINKYVNKKQSVDKLQRRLITFEDPKSPISESYRSLRTSLLYTNPDESTKSIMVSSPGPGEGKTTTIINLAITYANLNKKTVIIDTDLRKPVLHKVFNTSKDNGVSHYLSGERLKIEDVVHKTEIENLDLITCGAVPPNPSELLGSKKMKRMIKELEEKYDVILFDAPPLLAVTDAVVLSSLVNQFILVARVGVTDKGGLIRTLISMDQVNSSVTGVVLNALEFNNSYYSGYYYNYYNYYYYGSNKSS